MPPTKSKRKGIPVSNKDNKSNTKVLVTDEENVNLSVEEKVDSKSTQVGTKKKTGKKGNLSDGSKDETNDRKKQPKSKGATKNLTMGQSDDNEPHIVDDNKDFDENETSQLKKHPKKNLKGKSKIQDKIDGDGGLYDNSENIVPKKKPRNAILNADNSGDEMNSDEEIPFNENNDVPYQLKENETEKKTQVLQVFENEESENTVEEFNRDLNKTYVLPPRVTRSSAKKTNVPLDLPVDGVTNKVNDLKLNKNKSKQKTKKVLSNVEESGE